MVKRLLTSLTFSNNPSTIFIIIELLVLFVFLPLLYLLELSPILKIIPLVGLFTYCTLTLFANNQFTRIKFRIASDWKIILIRFAILTILIYSSIQFFSSYPLIANLAEDRKLMMMLFLYPFLSALPQEIIFREFFFYRYGSVLKNPILLIVLNVLLFAFAHLYFGNWIVIGFTLVGGLIFALTFLKTRSIMIVTIEHSLYGLVILSSGLSPFFYKAF